MYTGAPRSVSGQSAAATMARFGGGWRELRPEERAAVVHEPLGVRDEGHEEERRHHPTREPHRELELRRVVLDAVSEREHELRREDHPADRERETEREHSCEGFVGEPLGGLAPRRPLRIGDGGNQRARQALVGEEASKDSRDREGEPERVGDLPGAEPVRERDVARGTGHPRERGGDRRDDGRAQEPARPLLVHGGHGCKVGAIMRVRGSGFRSRVAGRCAADS